MGTTQVCDTEDAVSFRTSFASIWHEYKIFLTVNFAICLTMVVVGIYIVFWRYKSYKKPNFIKLVWVLLAANQVSNTVKQLLLWVWITEYDEEKDLFVDFLDTFTTAYTSLTFQLMAFIFSYEYFQAAMRFSLVANT